MTAKEYLMQYKLLTVRIQNAEANLEELRAERESISINLDGMPHGTDLSDKTARLATKLADMETALIDLRSAAWVKRMEIVHVIGKVRTAEHCRLLQLRYIDGLTWEQIAVEMGYTYQWVCVLHGRALEEIKTILNT